MTERVQVGDLQVARKLYDFVNDEALPGTGIEQAGFWSGFTGIVNDLAPRNRVDPSGRFVKKKNFGLVQQRTCQRQE